MAIETDISVSGPARLSRKTFILFFCIGLFMVSLTMAAMTAMKIQEFHFGNFSVLVPAGTLAFCITYLATDVISEVWGRGYAFAVVLTGLIMRAVMIGLILYAVSIEDAVGFITVADSWTPDRQDAFASTLMSTNRMNIAGMVAFGVSASADVLIYHFFQQRDAGKNRLWFRNNVSTMASQLLNSMIFITAAFLGSMPLEAVGSLILGQLIVKLLVAGLDTPAIYLLRNLAEGRRLLDLRG